MKAAPHRRESHIRPRQTSLHHHNALKANYSPASITHGVSSMMLQRKRVFIHVLLQARLCSATWDGGLSILANKHSNQMQDLKRPERISQRFLVKLDSSSYKKVSKSFTETSGLKNKSKADSEFLALPPSFTVGIIFLIKRRSIFKPDVTAAHLFWLVSPRNVCLNNHQDGFWLKWDEPSCSLLTAGGGILAWELSHECHFWRVSVLWGWTRTLSEACSSFDAFHGSFVTWMSRRLTLSAILVGRPLLGRFATVPSLLHLWIIDLTRVCWSSSFETFSRLMDFNPFASHFFWNFFGWWRDALVLKILQPTSLSLTDTV